MKKLTLTLITAVLTAIIILGWGFDTFFNQYQSQDNQDEFTTHRHIITALAATLDQDNHYRDFVDNWQQHSQHKLTVIPVAEFPLPASLQTGFQQGQPLVLESSDAKTVNQFMPLQQQVLTLTVPNTLSPPENTALQLMLTALFYSGILFCLIIWLYPLIKRLRLLRATTKAFGQGQYSVRIKPAKTSYTGDIENEFNRMADKIETLIQDNKLLGNAVSHDLRTPISRLRFGIEALSETTNVATREKYLRHLSLDVQEMENLVKVLLDYARLEQHLDQNNQQLVALDELVATCIQQQNQGQHDVVKIAPVICSKGNFNIQGDAQFLRMLVNNLLINAQQHGHSNVQVTLVNTPNTVTLTVADDGSGVDPELINEIVKPFTRGNNDQTKPGYGMGLAIVARISQWHRGELIIGQSDTLGGAEFTVSFRL